MRLAFVLGAGAAATAAFVACGDDDGAGGVTQNDAGPSTSSSSSSSSGATGEVDADIVDGGAPDAAPAEDTCGLHAASVCGRLARCAGAELLMRHGDLASCRTREEAKCRYETKLPGAVALPARCFAQPWSCDAPFGDDPTCQPRGLRAKSARCIESRQCASGHCSYLGPDAFPCGRCDDAPDAGPKRPLDAGAPCDPSGPDLCDSERAGQYCAENGTCSPIRFLDAGGPCDLVARDPSGLCVGSMFCIEPGGACEPFIPLGGVCTQFNPYCTKPEICDLDAGKCRLPPLDRCN